MKECFRDGCDNQVTSKDKRAKYCSSSCSAKVSNTIRNRTVKKYKCSVCEKETTYKRTRCDEHQYTKVNIKTTEEKNEYHLNRYYSKYSENKEKALDYLGNVCVICGRDSLLEFDHINPETKSYTITTKVAYYSWETLLPELDKCQLLCKKCHRDKTTVESSVKHGGGKTGKRGCYCELCGPKKKEYNAEYYKNKKKQKTEWLK